MELNWIGKRPFQNQLGLSDSQFQRWRRQAEEAGFDVFHKFSERTPMINIAEANRFIDWQCEQYEEEHKDIHLRSWLSGTDSIFSSSSNRNAYCAG